MPDVTVAAATPATKIQKASSSSSSSKSSRSEFDPSNFRDDVLDALKDDPRLVDLEIEEKKYALEAKREEASDKRSYDLLKLESDERIAMQKIEAEKAIAVAQAAAQEKQAQAQAAQTQLIMQLMDMVRERK